MASIMRLPVEILSEIFLHCGKKQDGCRPRLVATVCRKWRNIALATPNLWSDVRLAQEEIKVEALHSLLDLQLQRSGQVPLSIVFCEPRDTTSTLRLLLAVSHRWQSLDLSIFTDSQQELIQTSTNHFPVLEKLTIRIVPSLELGNLFRPLPLLRELELSWLNCPIPSTLPWSRLTKVTLRDASVVVALDVLHSAPNITELWLHYCYSDDGDCRTITSAIRSLKISHCRTGFCRDFLGHLTLPHLQELVLDCPDSGAVTSLFTGASFSITYLNLTGVELSERELIGILRLTDTVDHLDINWPSDVHSDTLMEALTIVPGTRRPRLLPKLRVLRITGGLSCHTDVLVAMLESRRPGLQLVELYYAGRTFFFDRAFDGLRKAGMEITVLLDGPVDLFAGYSREDESPN
ncbi:hypothetical protein B0H12DRAFT_703407 [Mycena haematopus]|nr:hypothetical protein B0H12DRAFT_703407 [Mycena haematopus]